ncbi:MAG: hypothetical protein HW387_1352 [Parachlamydiales bacterium]|nr:hypothetical protein [Parachlamydiales bacterium]
MDEKRLEQQPCLKDDLEKNQLAFENFWSQCRDQIAKDGEQKKSLNIQLNNYALMTFRIKDEFAKFRDALCEVPVAVAVGFWMKGLVSDSFWLEKYFSKMMQLQQRKLIPYLDSAGQPVTLLYFMHHGHQDILESIRCVKDWSLLEREEMVECYVQFSHSLSRETYGMVPHGFDPDRDRVFNKAVRYEAFLEFVQQLPERDSLIAKLLYFGAPSIDATLSLTRNALHERSIQFETAKIKFPLHVFQGLQLYLKDKPGSQKLVFANMRGAEVERAHLNQSFARACEKMSQNEKITPGGLLRLKGVSTGEYPAPAKKSDEI